MKMTLSPTQKVLIAVGVAVVAAAAIFFVRMKPARPDNSVLFQNYNGQPKLNVILIGVDNLRADALGSYANLGADTPVIDALAKNGATFSSFFQQSPMLLPNMTSVLTGQSPASHGVRSNVGFKLPAGHETLATMLKKSGYKTYAFLGASEYHRDHGLTAGFDIYDDSLLELSGIQHANVILRMFSRLLNEKVLDVMGGSKGPGDSPFFLWIQYGDLAHPYFPAKEPGRKTLENPYHVRVRELDHNLGELIEHLKKKHFLDNSVIILVGAKPEYFGEHQVTLPGTGIYNAQLSVPMILSSNKFFSKPVEIKSLHEGADIVPTVLDLLKLPQPSGLDGRSAVSEIFTGVVPDKDRKLLIETLAPVEIYGVSAKYALLTQDAKWIRNSEPGPNELYDLKNDFFEINRVEDREPAIADNLKRDLTELTDRLPRKPTEEAYLGRALSEPGSKFAKLFQELSGRPYEGKYWAASPDGLGLYSLEQAEKITRASLKAAEGGNVQGAMTILSRWLSRNPGDYTHSLLYSQLAASDPTKTDEVLLHAWNALELNPYMLASYAWLSEYYSKIGDEAKAKNIWQLAFAALPENLPSRIYAAISYLKFKDFAAIEALGKEIESRSATDASSFWAILSERAQAEKEMEKALEYSHRALKNYPKNVAALKSQTIFNITMNKWEEGFKDLRNFIALDPDAGHATLFQLITFYGTKLNKPAKANEFAKAFKDLTDGTVYESLIEAYFLKLNAQPSEAIKILEKALKKKVTPAQKLALLNTLGDLYMSIDDKDQARHYFQQLLDEEPYEASSANNLAHLLADEKFNIPMAQQWIQKSLSSNPLSPQYLDTLAGIYNINQQSSYAIKVGREAWQLSPPEEKNKFKEHLREYVKSSRPSSKKS